MKVMTNYGYSPQSFVYVEIYDTNTGKLEHMSLPFLVNGLKKSNSNIEKIHALYLTKPSVSEASDAIPIPIDIQGNCVYWSFQKSQALIKSHKKN